MSCQADREEKTRAPLRYRGGCIEAQPTGTGCPFVLTGQVTHSGECLPPPQTSSNPV